MVFSKRCLFFGFIASFFILKGNPSAAVPRKRSCGTTIKQGLNQDYFQKRQSVTDEALNLFERYSLESINDATSPENFNEEFDTPSLVEDLYSMILKSIHKATETDPTRLRQINSFHEYNVNFSRFFRFRYYDSPGIEIFFETPAPMEYSINSSVGELTQILKTKKSKLPKIQSYISRTINPQSILMDDWRPILLKMSLLTDLYSDKELLQLALSVSHQLSPLFKGDSKSNANEIGKDPSSIFSGAGAPSPTTPADATSGLPVTSQGAPSPTGEWHLDEFKGELKSLFHFSQNYPRLREALVSSGLSDRLKTHFSIELPTSLNLDTTLASNMVDQGELARFKDLKSGIQNNDLKNPFVPYIGQKLQNLPWRSIAALLKTQVANSILLDGLNEKKLRSLTVYHRTKDPKSAESIQNGNAFVSIGKNSVLGGAATWGDGVYLAYSDELYWYGAFMVPYNLNPQAILGEDVDFFIGQKDGLIVVVKTEKGLIKHSLENAWHTPPSDKEPVINHLHWFSKMAPRLNKDTKAHYLQSVIESSVEQKQWGPFELLILFTLDGDNFVNNEIRKTLKRHFLLQNQAPEDWPLQLNPTATIDEFKPFIDSRLTSLEKILVDADWPVRQQIDMNKNIPLFDFYYFHVPEIIVKQIRSSIGHHLTYTKMRDLNSPEILLTKALDHFTKSRDETATSFSTINWETLSDQRYLSIAILLLQSQKEMLSLSSGASWPHLTPIMKSIVDFFARDQRINSSLLEKYPSLEKTISELLRYKESINKKADLQGNPPL